MNIDLFIVACIVILALIFKKVTSIGKFFVKIMLLCILIYFMLKIFEII